VPERTLEEEGQRDEHEQVDRGDDHRSPRVPDRVVEADELARDGDEPDARALGHEGPRGFMSRDGIELAALKEEDDERLGEHHGEERRGHRDEKRERYAEPEGTRELDPIDPARAPPEARPSGGL